VIGLGTCVLLMAFVSPSALTIGVICLAFGAAYYYAVRQKVSRI